jgi:hypothetical protein
VPRTSPSPAEQRLLSEVRSRGLKASSYSLEKWRAHGLLAPLPRRALGRGRGSESWITDEYVEQACAVARAVADARSLDGAALLLFVRDQQEAPELVRRAYLRRIDGLIAAADAERLPDESLLDALDRWARKMAGGRMTPQRRRARARLKADGRAGRVQDVIYLQLLAMITGQLPDGEATELLATAVGAKAMTSESLAGQAPPAEELDLSGLEEAVSELDIFSLREHVERAEWDKLRQSRDLMWQMRDFSQKLLVVAEAHGAPDALGMRELAEMTDADLTVAALGGVWLLGRLSDEAAEFTRLMTAEGPRLEAIAGLLSALGPQRARTAILITRGEAVPDVELKEMQEYTRQWAVDHPSLADRLDVQSA